MRTLPIAAAAILLAAAGTHARVAFFHSVDGQITCRYGGYVPQLTCEIPPPTKPIPVECEPQDCPFGTWNGQWSGNISLFAKGSAHLNCNHHNYAKFQAGSYALPDNQPFKLFNQPGWQCTAQSGSLSCTNTEGHGFQISPDSLYRF
ncbi:hypothetical protein A7P98_01715 [Eikenella sp. NML080894]|uniref:hypothetical protein n=1 Tax=Eikenella TaxID=538 RepID=UPI0007DF0DF1|nr:MULTISPECIES: hypothetical protein [Eikenella]OAM36706.1 hypothetical protein A7P98_01715 [Eikenella sp. NML080894]OAM39790.1 hypothetical protein A7P99_00790 [Eikenella sp. NML120348]OAM45871.1 hypothetical protein A7Q03_00795 [Eikenella sp. NML99-0057]